MDTLYNKVHAWLIQNLAMTPETVIITGVSGGKDSICLLHVLHTLQKELPFSLIAVHINHMLRAEESDADEQFVQSLCQDWSIPVQVFKKDVLSVSRQIGCSVEEAGRIVRYACFNEVRIEKAAGYIAVAHHAQDQAETIFMNLLRGSGLDGLCGMEDVGEYIIRPLLTIHKPEIEAYLERHGLFFREDSSNLNPVYMRNTIRNNIFPSITKETGLTITAPLLRTAELLKLDRDYLNQQAAIEYGSVVDTEDVGKIVFVREKFSSLHPAIRGRVFRMAWEKITGSLKGLEAKHVDAANQLAKGSGANKSIDLPYAMKALVQYDRLILTNQKDIPRDQVWLKLSIPSQMHIPELGMQIITRLYSRDEYLKIYNQPEKENERSFTQIFDYNTLIGGIDIRNRLSGDSFHPYMGPGRKKIKDYFIDEKIPRSERDDILLLAKGNNIIWIIGYRTSDDYKVTKATETILYIQIDGREKTPSRAQYNNGGG